MTDTVPTSKYKPASNVNCLRILAARLSEHLSPAEKREIEKAIAELTATQEALAMAKKEVQRLTDCLAKANAGFEEFERKYYLESDRLEEAQEALTQAKLESQVCMDLHRALGVEWGQALTEVEMKDRKTVLLRAAYDLLQKVNKDGFVDNVLETTVFYDDAECDGSCLRDDIAIELAIEPIDD